ncbi:hypothetical protein GF407_04075 [candidate division KSB1 bacterium]|nr:hypothetical protein [candidate division KSB1 bacterium]
MVFSGYKHIWQPEHYHGDRIKPPFFEGWYYKLVDKDKKTTLAIIPAIFKAKNNPHASVQVLDSHSYKTIYCRYPLSAFTAGKEPFELIIGNNRFTRQSLELDIRTESRRLTGKCTFDDLAPWPIKRFSPGAMGWYAFIPFLQCYHAVLSFDHKIDGSLELDHRKIDMNQGKGYLEKDWGRGFPNAYIWLQCNHFKNPGTSFMLSIAHIPWLNSAFRGLLAGLFLNGRLYRFTTYTGAKVKSLLIAKEHISIILQDRNYRLQISARKVDTGTLYGPQGEKFSYCYDESLTSTLALSLQKTGKRNKTIADLKGSPAAMDINGDLNNIT